MPETFELEIIRPTKTEKLVIEWVSLQSPTGNFVIGPDHAPLVSLLSERGEMTYQVAGGSKKTVDVFGGVIKVMQGKAIMFLDE